MNSHSTVLKPLIEYKPPSNFITVQKPDNTVSQLTIADYNQFFNVSLSHGTFYNPKYQDLVDELQKKKCLHPSGKEESVQHFLNNPKTYFAVRYVNKTCGYGLAALEDIPKQTVVGIYSGELVFECTDEIDSTMTPKQQAYDMHVADDVELKGKIYSLSIRALYHSDLTRFASHFPSIVRRNKLPLDKSINRDKILTENIDYSLAVIDGKPVNYLISIQDIKKGDFVGINYGLSYWKVHGNPCIFERMNSYLQINYYDAKKQKYTPSKEFINSKLARIKPVDHTKPERKNEPPKKKLKVFHNPSKSKPSITHFSLVANSHKVTPMELEERKPLFKRPTRLASK